MSHNDLDLQTRDLKFYVCIPVVLQQHAEYALLYHNQEYGTTIAYIKKKGSVYL